jgi:hypothetical protein
MKRVLSSTPKSQPAPALTGLGAGRRFALLARMLRDRLLRRKLPAAAAHTYPPGGLAVRDGDAVSFPDQRKPSHDRDTA